MVVQVPQLDFACYCVTQSQRTTTYTKAFKNSYYFPIKMKYLCVRGLPIVHPSSYQHIKHELRGINFSSLSWWDRNYRWVSASRQDFASQHYDLCKVNEEFNFVRLLSDANCPLRTFVLSPLVCILDLTYVFVVLNDYFHETLWNY